MAHKLRTMKLSLSPSVMKVFYVNDRPCRRRRWSKVPFCIALSSILMGGKDKGYSSYLCGVAGRFCLPSRIVQATFWHGCQNSRNQPWMAHLRRWPEETANFGWAVQNPRSAALSWMPLSSPPKKKTPPQGYAKGLTLLQPLIIKCIYSTVTDLARLRGLSTSRPLASEV